MEKEEKEKTNEENRSKNEKILLKSAMRLESVKLLVHAGGEIKSLSIFDNDLWEVNIWFDIIDDDINASGSTSKVLINMEDVAEVAKLVMYHEEVVPSSLKTILSKTILDVAESILAKKDDSIEEADEINVSSLSGVFEKPTTILDGGKSRLTYEDMDLLNEFKDKQPDVGTRRSSDQSKDVKIVKSYLKNGKAEIVCHWIDSWK